MDWLDISVPVDEGIPTFNGDPDVRRERVHGDGRGRHLQRQPAGHGRAHGHAHRCARPLHRRRRRHRADAARRGDRPGLRGRRHRLDDDDHGTRSRPPGHPGRRDPAAVQDPQFRAVGVAGVLERVHRVRCRRRRHARRARHEAPRHRLPLDRTVRRPGRRPTSRCSGLASSSWKGRTSAGSSPGDTSCSARPCGWSAPMGRRPARCSAPRAGSDRCRRDDAGGRGHARTPGSIHLRDVRRPTLADVPDGRGVARRGHPCRGLRHRPEIVAAEFGTAPGRRRLPDHRSREPRPDRTRGSRRPAVGDAGTLVVATVRRPGTSIYDRIGRQDLTTDEACTSAGSTGSMASSPRPTSTTPRSSSRCRSPGAVASCWSRSRSSRRASAGARGPAPAAVWQPERAAVFGAGPIGLLAALVFRLRGLDVTVTRGGPGPTANSELAGRDRRAVRELRLRRPLDDAGDAARPVRPDLRCDRLQPAGLPGGRDARTNGVLVLAGVTSGGEDREIDGTCQPALRARQPGDGGDGQRPRTTSSGRRRPVAGGSLPSRLARESADHADRRPGGSAHRCGIQGPGHHQGVRCELHRLVPKERGVPSAVRWQRRERAIGRMR